jgi:hypothetical protein
MSVVQREDAAAAQKQKILHGPMPDRSFAGSKNEAFSQIGKTMR